MFDFSTITQWVDELLRSFLPHAAATLVEFILIGLCLLVGYAVIALVLIYVERKVCAFFQCRLGPNRVGPYGLLQSVADMFKMLIKELIEIKHTDKFLFNLAPYIVIVSSISTFALPLVLLPLSIVPLFESVSFTYQPSLRRRSTQ